MDTETFYGRCPGYYFKKCLRERQVLKTRTENQVQEVSETVKRCCDGYVKNEQKNTCQPICDHHCEFGSCTAPNKCTCYEGYVQTESTYK